MQWSDTPGGGFTGAGRPWLPLGDVAAANVTAQREDPDSVLALCRELIAFRRARPEFSGGDYVSLPAPEGVWAWARGPHHVVVLNMSPGEAGLDGVDGTVRVCTQRARAHEVVPGPLRLAPFQGMIIERP